MLCAVQIGINRKQTKTKVIVIAFLVCFIAVSLLSEALILTHANHIHNQNGIDGSCMTCVQMQAVESLLKQISMAGMGAAFILAGLFAVCAIIGAIYSNAANLTPITQKNRMNN